LAKFSLTGMGTGRRRRHSRSIPRSRPRNVLRDRNPHASRGDCDLANHFRMTSWVPKAIQIPPAISTAAAVDIAS